MEKYQLDSKSGSNLTVLESTFKNSYFRRIRLLKRLLSHIFLILVSVFAVFPVYYIVITSLSPIPALIDVSAKSILPSISTLTLANYRQIIYDYPFGTWLKNTLFLTGTSTVLGVMLALTSGIAMSRMRIPGKKALLYMMLIISTFPFVIMVIPFYFMFSSLHLVNSYVGLIIAYSAGAVIFSSWLIKNYADSIPRDYEEAAQLDGYSRTGALFRVLLPIAKPVIIFALIISFIGPYTDYALVSVLIDKPHLYTLTIGMYSVVDGTLGMNYGTFSAFALLMGLPIFIIFFVFQRYLSSGFSLSMYK